MDHVEMGVDGQAPSRIDKALLGGPPQRVGWFEYRYDDDVWVWSDTVARLHGYQPGSVTPTTEMVLGHKHPDDLAQVRALLAHSAAPFSSRHRIITTAGDVRNVVVVGDAVRDADGRVIATRGFYIDITDSFNDDLQRSIDDQMEVILARREVINQAKGMLMAVYNITADAAFDVLRWRSQELNVKLFAVAQKVVADLPAVLDAGASRRTPIDHFLIAMRVDG